MSATQEKKANNAIENPTRNTRRKNKQKQNDSLPIQTQEEPKVPPQGTLLIRMREIMEVSLKELLGKLQANLTQKIEVKKKFEYLDGKMKSYNSKIEDVLPKVENRLTLFEGKQGTHHLHLEEIEDKNQSLLLR